MMKFNRSTISENPHPDIMGEGKKEHLFDVEVSKVKSMIKQSLIIGAMATALLTGCSSSSDDSTTTTPPVTGTSLTGKFVDAPVVGLSYQAGGENGTTNNSGEFQYEANDLVTFIVGPITLGSTTGKSLVTPFDLSADSNIVKAIASLLQSLDDDNTDDVITLSPAKIAALTDQVGTIDFSTLVDDPDTVANEVQDVLDALDLALQTIGGTEYTAPNDALLVMLSDLTQTEFMSTNVSKSPEAISDKAGVNILDSEVPARASNGDLLTDYGTIQPIVMTYSDGVGDNGEFDAFAAVSYDNGATWKRTNLSRQAGKDASIGSFDFKASAAGPSMHVEGDYILVSWISTYCQGGADYVDAGTIPAAVENPAKTVLETEGTYTPGVDTTVDDLFQVLGSQGTVDYSAIYPDVGVVPYHCVWTARGVLDVDGSLGTAMGLSSDTTGQVIWYKPQQSTSGVRDAKLDTPAGLDGYGFGLVWQEDPDGLEPGQGEGPGVGWSGALTHHTTDIWYSYIKWADFAAYDTIDTETGRPTALYTLSVPVPVSDNVSCNVSATNPKPVCQTTTFCADTAAGIPIQGGDDTAEFCVVDYDSTAGYTANVDSVLDGDTAASRPNLSFAPVLDGSNNVIGARALVMYEESKGLCELGNGCDESALYPYDTGKFVMYHHMPDFAAPDMVASGDILSSPVQLATSDPFDEGASYIPTDDGATTTFDESELYENTRRERFVVNSDPTNDTKFVVIYKQGWYNQGERADIFMRRAVGGYDITDLTEDVCVSCVQPESVTTVEDGTALTAKMESWSWTPANLDDESWTNPYDDARSLRAQLNGDRLLVGFAWTPNWKLATTSDPDGRFKDHYDFYVRRSFDGGATFTDYSGADEGPQNASYLDNNKESVVEPRLAVLDDSDLACSQVAGEYDGSGCIGESTTVTNESLMVVTYCTAANQERVPVGGIPVHAPGLDCYYSWSGDNGETYLTEGTKEVTIVDETGTEQTITVPEFDCLACGDQEQVEPEVVLTEGSSFTGTPYETDHANVVAEMHAGWVQNGDPETTGSDLQNGSDAWYGLFELNEIAP